MSEDAATLAARAERSPDPTEGLRAVRELRARLDELEADQVARALGRGWSWAQVGRSLRISKQAAHRRHADRAREGCVIAAPVASSPEATREEPRVMITGAARDVVARARHEATRLGEREVRPEHLLLALLEAPAGLAREALVDLGVDAKRTRSLIERETAPAGQPPAEPLSVSAATRVVLEGSLAESQRLCHGHLGPEHLLLALLRDDDGPAAELLARMGAAPADLEDAVCDVLKRADFARSQ